MTNSHISARISNTQHFLINPYDGLFDKVTGSSVLKVDLHGEILRWASGELEIPSNESKEQTTQSYKSERRHPYGIKEWPVLFVTAWAQFAGV